jgi:hypothetical protein
MSASRRVCCPSECCMSRRIELSGFLRPRYGLPISGGPTAVRPPRPFPAKLLGKRDHPLVSFALVQRLFDCHLPSVPCLPRHTSDAYLGVSSLFAMSATGVHARPGSQTRPSVHPRRFSRPRWFPPPVALRACFIPLPRPGFRFRGFLPPIRSADSSPSRPSSPLAPSSYRVTPAPALDASTSRVCSD